MIDCKIIEFGSDLGLFIWIEKDIVFDYYM